MEATGGSSLVVLPLKISMIMEYSEHCYVPLNGGRPFILRRA